MQDLTTVAYHEAGHAVCAFALHLEVERVTIEPGEDCVAGVEIAQGRDLWWWRRVMIVLFAGDIAQRHHNPDDRRRGDSDDLLKAAEIIDRFFARPDRKKWLAALAQEAEDIIEQWWPEVHRVAEELMRRRTLSGREITSIVYQCELDAPNSTPAPGKTTRDAFRLCCEALPSVSDSC